MLAAFIAVFLLTRLPRLGSDIVNSDSPMWHNRSKAFMEALAAHDFAGTYQKYHPGVTLTWIAGLAFDYARNSWNLDSQHNFANFEIYHYTAKIFLVFEQLGLSLIAIYLLAKIFDFNKALLIVSLLSLEPFFVANSRLLHLDSLFTLYLFNGLLLAYLAIKEFSPARAIFAGFFLAAAFLTKSIGVLALPFIFIYGMRERGFLALGILTAAFTLSTVLMFPAMWVQPVQTLTRMFTESREVAFDKGHNHIFFGRETDNPGPFFYPFVLLLRLSPLFLFAPVIFYLNKKSQNSQALTFLGLFYLVYFIFMTVAPKKLDRYMLTLFPIFAIWLVLGIQSISKKYLPMLLFSVLTFQIFPLVSLFPNYFVYSSPILGSAQNANKIIAQKAFGVGVFDLRQRLIERYPDKTMAISDEGPLKEIYGSFRVSDIWKANPKSYDLLILGPNVPMPEIASINGRTFKQIDSVWIGGLEFWRIYR